MSAKVESIHWPPLVFNSADWDLVQTQPFWHSFHYDWEVGRQIKHKMSKRGNVWGIGLWPDTETEKVGASLARQALDSCSHKSGSESPTARSSSRGKRELLH
ncbi:MAG: hypothetical protein KBT68_02155 [bacterium]|nr:hypothetical protein [Candidatus Colisoma equi]